MAAIQTGAAMTLLVRFTPELRRWLLSRLDDGRPAADLIAEMVAHRMAPEAAQAIVAAFVDARRRGLPPPQDSVTLPDAAEFQPPDSRLGNANVISLPDCRVPVLARLARPCVTVLENVFSAEECDQLIALARPRLKASTIVDPGSGRDVVRAHRSSTGMFFRLRENALLARLDERLAALGGWPPENGEGLQVLHYPTGAENTPHYDYLVPGHARNDASLARSGQRVATIVVYLNDVEAGGETTFPEAGLRVQARRGNAVCFEYCDADGQLDMLSVHAGAPVLAGEKWVATKWLRARRFVPAGAAGAEGVVYA